MRLNLAGLVAGALFGGLLAGARLHEYDTIHAMLRLDEPDVFLLMGSAIAVAMPGLRWLEQRGIMTPLGGGAAAIAIDAGEISHPRRGPVRAGLGRSQAHALRRPL